MILNRYGIEFLHDGDAVIWVFPWRRKLNSGKPFYSHSFQAGYSTLAELDKEWEGYEQACRRSDD